MSLGEGVFLSSLFLGVILLYIFTKDRWKWRKIVYRSVVAIISLTTVLGVGGYTYFWYLARPQRVDSLWDISIGASQADVTFAKGAPTTIEDGQTASPRWIYKLADIAYIVDLKNGGVERIIAIGDSNNLPWIDRISPYTAPEVVLERLGTPSHVSRTKDELTRAYSFSKYNVAFGYKQGKIEAVAVGVTEDRPLELKNEPNP